MSVAAEQGAFAGSDLFGELSACTLRPAWSVCECVSVRTGTAGGRGGTAELSVAELGGSWE